MEVHFDSNYLRNTNNRFFWGQNASQLNETSTDALGVTFTTLPIPAVMIIVFHAHLSNPSLDMNIIFTKVRRNTR